MGTHRNRPQRSTDDSEHQPRPHSSPVQLVREQQEHGAFEPQETAKRAAVRKDGKRQTLP